MTIIKELHPSGIQRKVWEDGIERTVDPVLPRRPIYLPSERGPILISGHTPGCRNAYGDSIDDNVGTPGYGKPLALNGVGCKPSDCECQGKEAEG